MELLTYRFSKELNSTKQPGTPLHTYDVKLKSNTTVLSPTFLINGIDLTVNYCKWDNRFYFINDIVLNNNNIYEINCSIDELATWKSEILSSTQYVLRSASLYDGDISDSYYPAKSIWRYVNTTTESAPRNQAVRYVVGIINNTNTKKLGSVTYYNMSGDDCKTMLNYLMSDTPHFNIPDEIMDPNLQKAQINPIQYIVSCVAIPQWQSGSVLFWDSASAVKVGWWEIPGLSCTTLNTTTSQTRAKTADFTMAVPHHPDIEVRESPYLDYSPWTYHTFYWEPYGTIQIDPSLIYDCGNLRVIEYVDVISGQGFLNISGSKTNANKQIVYASAQVGATIMLSQMAIDHIAQSKVAISTAAGAISGTTGAIANIASGNIGAGVSGIVNSIAGTASGILDMKQASTPRLEKSGANNSIASFQMSPVLYTTFIRPVDDDLVHLGRPLCRDVQLSTLSGYCMTRDAELSLPCLAGEVETIKSLMNSGFYIE